jgi:hypothetical protein
MSEQEMDALIVRHIDDLEAATKRLKESIQVEVGAAIDKIIKKWAEENKWFAKLGFNESGAWVAEESWRMPDTEQSADKFFGSFYIHVNDAGITKDGNWNSEFWLTQLCGCGPGAAGFRWSYASKEIGATKGDWKRFLREKDFPQKLAKFGFDYEEKFGDFFIRFSTINNQTLATAIEGENIEDALEPVRAALKTIEKAFPQFNDLLQSARKHFSSKQGKPGGVPAGSG